MLGGPGGPGGSFLSHRLSHGFAPNFRYNLESKFQDQQNLFFLAVFWCIQPGPPKPSPGPPKTKNIRIEAVYQIIEQSTHQLTNSSSRRFKPSSHHRFNSSTHQLDLSCAVVDLAFSLSSSLSLPLSLLSRSQQVSISILFSPHCSSTLPSVQTVSGHRVFALPSFCR